jgi:hypothetical protein
MEAYSSLQDPAHSQSPMNVHRQDSAVTQQHLPKGTGTVAPASEPTSSYFNQTPSHAHHSSSPGRSSHPTTPLSLLSPANITQPSNPASHPVGHALQRSYATSPATGTHIVADTSRVHEHLTEGGPPLTSTGHAHSGMVPPLPPDPIHQTKQQRYNVRFAANHTPDNMPSSQKPKHDPPFTSPPVTESNGAQQTPKEQPVVPGPELAIQALTSNAQHPNEQSHAQVRNKDREDSMHATCDCGHVWTRPLPSSLPWSDDSQSKTKTTNDMARANTRMIMSLEQHGKEADASYKQWAKIHANCARTTTDLHGPRPRSIPYVEQLHSRPSHRASQNDTQVEATTNKRKSELSHNEETSKVRRVIVDPHTSNTPHTRPSSLA